MKFISLTETAVSDDLNAEYKAAREIGVLRLGEKHLFFRKGLKHYVIPFSEIKRAFRRVELIPASMCCGKGDLAIENLVICAGSDKDTETCVIQLPGTKAAKSLMEELRVLLPEADLTAIPSNKTEV